MKVGVIIRTNALEREEIIVRIWKRFDKWREIEKGIRRQYSPKINFKEMSSTSGVLRDLFSK